MKTLNLIKGLPPVVILKPSEYYNFVIDSPNYRPPSVVFVKTLSGKYVRESCSGVDCSQCPFLEVSFRDYRIPFTKESYDGAYCGGINQDLFVRSILSPMRLAKTKDLHELHKTIS